MFSSLINATNCNTSWSWQIIFRFRPLTSQNSKRPLSLHKAVLMKPCQSCCTHMCCWVIHHFPLLKTGEKQSSCRILLITKSRSDRTLCVTSVFGFLLADKHTYDTTNEVSQAFGSAIQNSLTTLESLSKCPPLTVFYTISLLLCENCCDPSPNNRQKGQHTTICCFSFGKPTPLWRYAAHSYERRSITASVVSQMTHKKEELSGFLKLGSSTSTSLWTFPRASKRKTLNEPETASSRSSKRCDTRRQAGLMGVHGGNSQTFLESTVLLLVHSIRDFSWSWSLYLRLSFTGL